ncbi:hypothetical protein GLAREA_03200 [Glarea lozoyensis ATCC 20868]|uniref:Uncharacterized protein n=1 Tax=Glarea lozoyensis (strain ATCC 20868 / MF5171) TaxID=1116229 RepID=S3CNL4_GLAL2|nr:uncharacterized protein GLAREA_03200 [Glarea lozoyensis ATCC 20868]EPE27285.1 hypothetical protein GLAREA_03200 [Glarea lozoyensis ATCC 20868]
MATQKPRQTLHRPTPREETHGRCLEDSWIDLPPETPTQSLARRLIEVLPLSPELLQKIDYTLLDTPEGHRQFLERERKAVEAEDKLYREAIEHEIEQNRLNFEYRFRKGGPWLEEDNYPYPIRQRRDSKSMIGNLVGFFENKDRDRK